jgi:type II secretory pathway pseudopilin PulG
MRIPGQPVSWNPSRRSWMGAPSQSPRPQSAFTMIEIALCIAVVAIAMVAIIGVLPAGLNVQKQNREESLLTQDAELLLNVLRGGQTRLQDLLNYADRVTLVRQYRDRAPARTNYFHGPLVQGSPAGSDPLVDAQVHSRGLHGQSGQSGGRHQHRPFGDAFHEWFDGGPSDHPQERAPYDAQ